MTFPWLKTNAIWIHLMLQNSSIYSWCVWMSIDQVYGSCISSEFQVLSSRASRHVTSCHVMSWWADNNVQYVGWCQQIAANKDITCYALTWVYNNNFFKQIFDVLFLSRGNLNLHTWAIPSMLEYSMMDWNVTRYIYLSNGSFIYYYYQ